MEQLIKDIINNNIPCYFISPHLDDAVLSAGGLLSYLASKVPVKIITIFTEGADGPYTFFTKRFLQKTGHLDARDLYIERKKEDREVCQMLRVEPVHLGFIDGAFRKKIPFKFFKQTRKLPPEITHLYPLGRKIFKLASEDQKLAEEIEKKLRENIATNETKVIFCPLGTVIHPDHEITRRVCVASFTDIIFWKDYPYITDQNYNNSFLSKNHLKSFPLDYNLDIKKKMIAGYKNQIKSLFPQEEIPLIPETFYMK